MYTYVLSKCSKHCSIALCTRMTSGRLPDKLPERAARAQLRFVARQRNESRSSTTCSGSLFAGSLSRHLADYTNHNFPN